MGMQDPNGRPGTDTEDRRITVEPKVLCDPNSDDHLQYLVEMGRKDGEGLVNAHKHYGNSWKRRGGVSAFMMLCRKWDRLEKFCDEHGWDIFKALDADERGEGIIDDIRDLRRYLLLVEAEAKARGIKCASAGHRDNLAETGAAATKRLEMTMFRKYAEARPQLEDRDPGPPRSVSDPQGR